MAARIMELEKENINLHEDVVKFSQYADQPIKQADFIAMETVRANCATHTFSNCTFHLC